MTRRRKVLLSITVIVVVFGVAVSTSVVSYVLANPGVAVQQNVAQWARNNNLGAVVNVLELWLRTDPPSTEVATELGLATDDTTNIDDTDIDDAASTSTTIETTTTNTLPTSTTAETTTTTTNPADIVANTTATGSQGDIDTGVPAPVATTTTIP
ncbi:MAG: hypothetical protein ACKOFD_02320, partial [Actinomycetota bacterium]